MIISLWWFQSSILCWSLILLLSPIFFIVPVILWCLCTPLFRLPLLFLGGVRVVCEYSAQQEGVVQEELTLVNRSRRDSSIRVRLQARVMGEIHSLHTPTADRSLVIRNRASTRWSQVWRFWTRCLWILSWDRRNCLKKKRKWNEMTIMVTLYNKVYKL